MLIDLQHLIKKYKLGITGVIHVGAHYGQEYDAYIANNITDIVFVEPSKKAFEVLFNRFNHKPNVDLINCAFGNQKGQFKMFTESRNQGQSNSLLKPKGHLAAHPEIKFEGTELVELEMMDIYNFTGKNLLMMDVQGFEKHVLEGGPETLKRINYVYTEVNTAELYENCTRLSELDQMLNDFTRVETVMCGDKGWGDAFYIRTSLLPHVPSSFVPFEFRPDMAIEYPADNTPAFEIFYFLNSPDMAELPAQQTVRIYLPVLWTSYYIKHDYGNDKAAIKTLQKFLNALPRNLKYYTIVQYDDGILNDISHLDIKVFAMSGNRIDYALPLLCQPHPVTVDTTLPRRYISNFVGNDNHPVRTQMIRTFRMLPNYFVNGRRLESNEFCKLLSRSTFTFCPRGYGKTSFRICEALQFGSIPIYISDEHVLPHDDIINFAAYSLVIHPHEIRMLPGYLTKLMRQPDLIRSMQEFGKLAYEKLYTFEANKLLIDKAANA